MSEKISLLIPTRHRADRYYTAIESFINNCEDINNFEIVVGIEITDFETLSVYNQVKEVYYECDWSLVLFDEGLTLNKKYNMLYNESKHGIIFGIADDNIMLTTDWDAKIIQQYAYRADKIMCVAVNDGPGADELFRHFTIHRNWIDTVGYYFNENFSHFYIDNLVTYTSKAIGRAVFLEDVKIDHKHFVFGTAEPDENNVHAYTVEFQKDKEEYDKHRDGIVNYEINVLKQKLMKEQEMVTNYI